jgi:hypothetical protein
MEEYNKNRGRFFRGCGSQKASPDIVADSDGVSGIYTPYHGSASGEPNNYAAVHILLLC